VRQCGAVYIDETSAAPRTCTLAADAKTIEPASALCKCICAASSCCRLPGAQSTAASCSQGPSLDLSHAGTGRRRFRRPCTCSAKCSRSGSTVQLTRTAAFKTCCGRVSSYLITVRAAVTGCHQLPWATHGVQGTKNLHVSTRIMFDAYDADPRGLRCTAPALMLPLPCLKHACDRALTSAAAPPTSTQ
jgi:hypothetical protein